MKKETLEEVEIISKQRIHKYRPMKPHPASFFIGFRAGAEWQMDKQDNFATGFAEWSVTRALGCDTFTINQDELNIYKKYIDTLNGN